MAQLGEIVAAEVPIEAAGRLKLSREAENRGWVIVLPLSSTASAEDTPRVFPAEAFAFGFVGGD